MGQVILYVLLGALITALLLPLLYFGLKRRATYTALTIDDLIDYFQQLNQETLSTIAGLSPVPEAPKEASVEISGTSSEVSITARRVLERANRRTYVYRRHVRLNLDLLRDYTERMLHNAARPGRVAYADLCKMHKHKLTYTADAVNAIYELIDADRAFRKFAHSVLRKIWLWSLIRFEERTWGPIPDLASFQIRKMMEMYNRVKRATEAYALFYGDIGKLISEEIKVKM